MKKTVLIMTAAAFLGTGVLAPVPASAIPILLPLVLMSKKDPNFHEQNPYAKAKVKHHKKHKAKKAKKKM